MEQISVGDKINIQRSDGCVQCAVIGLKNIERQVVTVEWTQGSKVKGKEIPWNAVLELNPSLAKKCKEKPQREPKTPTRNSPGFNMYRSKKLNNSPFKKRLRVASRSDVAAPSLVTVPNKVVSTMLPQQQSEQTPPPSVAQSMIASTHILPRSNVVRQVEHMRVQRELRRAQQAEQRKARNAMQRQDPGNPNWEVALMVRTYREQLQFNPLRYVSPRGVRTQQITVCVRKRPMSRLENQLKMVDIISVPTRDSLLVHELRHKVDLTKFLEHHKFRFDYTFDDMSSNQLVYEYTARPLIRTMFEGGNATCFAYGQTGSGKTHTMGGEFIGKTQDGTTGIYALAARDVFAELDKPSYQEIAAYVTCSYFEIYGSKVFDLLLPQKPLLRILEDGRQQVIIVGLTTKPVTKVEEVLAIIEQGNRERTSGQTSVNIKSSRSHAVFQMSLHTHGNEEPWGKCSFVDLAGNERGADTQSASKETRREGAEINKSLLALKECIRAMSRHSSHLPFRGSKLTQVLRDSFIGGERNKTCMIAMLSPSLNSVENTLNTLRYADRVKELLADKGDGVVDMSFDASGNDGEKSSEVDEDTQVPLNQYSDADSDESVDHDLLNETNYLDFNSSKTSGCNSPEVNKSRSNDETIEADIDESNNKNAYISPGIKIPEIIMQHGVLFGFIHNFKENFQKNILDNSTSADNEDMAKFMLDVEPCLRELEALVKNTHNMVVSYNAQKGSESEEEEEE